MRSRRNALPRGTKSGAPSAGALPATIDKYAHDRVYYSRRSLRGAKPKAGTSGAAAATASSLRHGRRCKGGKGITARPGSKKTGTRKLQCRRSSSVAAGDAVYVRGDRGSRGRGEKRCAQQQSSLLTSTQSTRAKRRKTREQVPGCGGGSKGHMGAAWRRSKARHEGMPTFGTFNMGGGTRNRWDVVKNRYGKLDVLGLQEFSSSHGKWKGPDFADEDGGRLILGEKPRRDDPSGSAALRLSPRMVKAVVDGSSGCLGSRIVYARLKLGVQFIFVVSVYVPYWQRGCGSKGKVHAGVEAQAVHRQLQTVLDSKAKSGDAVVILTDTNAKLAPTESGRVGRYCVQRHANDAGRCLLDFMRKNDLVAANTLFKPRCHRKLQQHSRAHTGCVTYRKGGRESQIDYILVSRRWQSSVVYARVSWGASLDLQSTWRTDHGAVIMRWKEKIKRSEKPPPKLDPRSYDDMAVALRATNAGRQAAGEPTVTAIQLKRQLEEHVQKAEDLATCTTFA